MTRKPDPAEIELQLSERRFILESLQTVAQLLQVPLVTAGVWYYISRTNATMGALNKAILTAELAPIVGDIEFPEGVLLGAAMESTEDFLNILEQSGLLSVDDVKKEAIEATQDAGDMIGDYLVGFAPSKTCEELKVDTERSRNHARGIFEREFTATEKILGGAETAKILGAIAYSQNLKLMKKNKCERPSFVSEGTWLKA